MKNILLFTLLLLAPTPAQAQQSGDECNSYNPQRTTQFPAPVSLEEGIKQMGREQANLAIDKAIEILAGCRYLRNDPYNWSHRRLLAMTLIDAVLPITVHRINFSANCRSALPTRGCQVEIDYQIENISDDFTFSSVGVSCQGMLKFSWRRPGVPDEPRYAQLALVHYDPVIDGRPLAPHERRQFSMWFDIGTAQCLRHKQFNESRECARRIGLLSRDRSQTGQGPAIKSARGSGMCCSNDGERRAL